MDVQKFFEAIAAIIAKHGVDPDVMEESDGEIWEVVGNTIDNPEMLREGGC